MKRIPAILFFLFAMTLVLLFFAFTSGEQPVEQEQTAQLQPTTGEPEVGEIVEVGPVRQVSPGLFAAPFAENAVRLERIAPRQPLTPPKETGPETTLLHQPVVIAAGLVTYAKGDLQLADIEVLEPQSVCIDINGFAWPCGIIARTSFRNFMRGRAMSCVVPEGRWDEIVVSRCSVGTQDPAAWLVRSGWARALPDTEYVALEEIARNGAKGIYGSDPRNLSAVVDSGVQVQPSDVVTEPAPQPEPSE